MRQFFSNLNNFFQPLNGPQKALFGLFVAGLLTMISLVFYWALTPSYAMLFGSLPPESAKEIVDELQSKGIKYELTDNGQTIRVPREKVYDLRLEFASLGSGGSEYQGYELFDQNALGMTDFMQRLNQKRALEGELSRTINSLEQVDGSRVHIVIPERSPFQETTVEPSASVILNMKRGKSLGKDQIEGMGSLIAGSVEGLTIENVVILDQVGNRISENVSESADVAASSAQIKVRRDMENYLTDKGQTMLDRVLGPGNSILRVSTEHDFDRITRESAILDPESRIIISEEKRTSRNAGESQEPVQGAEEVEPFVSSSTEDESTVQVRNYDVSRTSEQHENGVGEITRISASVLLNLKQQPSAEGNGEREVVQYTAEEIAEITTIMRNALGITENRGDELSVTQIRFQDPFVTDPGADGWIQPFSYMELVKYIILAIVMIAISIIIYRMTKNFNVEYNSLAAASGQNSEKLPGGAANYLTEKEGGEDDEEDYYEQKLSKEARRKLKASEHKTDEISSFIDQNAPEAAGLVRTLMNQNSY